MSKKTLQCEKREEKRSIGGQKKCIEGVFAWVKG